MIEPTTEFPPPFHIRHRFWILLLLTLAGAVLRFATLDRPPLWGDEALTYSRVIGSFGDMVDILRFDGFTPLHYEIYWWLQHGMPVGSVKLAPHLLLTPSIMRVIPSLCGTLMIPAMYFAARQLSTVRTALLSAAYACFSAYIIAYSHDAKMYVQTWLFITVNLACVWWWLRTGSFTAWLAWVATGSAAVGFHIAAGLMLLPQPLFFLTARQIRWRGAFAMVAGLLLIAAGPVGYYSCFNQWNRQSGGLLPAASGQAAQAEQWKDNSGIGWIEERNQDATGPGLVRATASAYLIGTEWTDPANRKQVVDPRVSSIVEYATIFVMGLVILGALPWRLPWRPRRAKPVSDTPAEPWWRVLLWLSLLLLAPVYGFFYCRSVHEFASPLDWWNWARPLVLPLGLPCSIAIFYFSGHTMRERLLKLSQLALVAGAVIGLCVFIHGFWQNQYDHHWAKMRELYGEYANRESRPELDWMSIWMPRYIGIVWPAMAIAVCAVLMRLPTRWVRGLAIVVLLGINATNAMLRMYVGTQPPQPRFFSDVAAVRDGHGKTRIIMSSLGTSRHDVLLWFRASNFGVYGDAGRYYACTVLGLHTTPSEFRSGEVVNQYHDWIGELVPPQSIASVIESDPNAQRLIVWERYGERARQPGELDSDDAIVRALGERWTPVHGPEIFWLRSWYDWSEMGWMQRREFVRAASPASPTGGGR